MDLCIDNPQPSSPSPSPPFNETNHNIENNTCERFITTTTPSTQNNNTDNNSNNAVARARKHMNTLLKQQQTSENDVQEAQRKLIEAQKALQSCQSKRDIIQKQIEDASESLTDSLLKVKSTWNDMYFKLVEYKKKYGNCDVKRTLLPHEKEATPDLVTLGAWVGRNRLEVRKHPDRIEPYKITALNRLGFDFDPRESYWMDNYYRLKDYMAVHGQGKMPTRRKSALGVWCDGQIIAYNKFMSGNPSYITQRKIDLLNIIGFVWDRNGNSWGEKYKALKSFYERNRHCRVPKNYEDKVLYRWIGKERIKYRNFVQHRRPCQSEDQFQMLQAIGFMEDKKLEIKETRLLNGNP